MHSEGTTPAGTIPDNELIAKILQGDKEMYALIMRRYNQRLYRVAMSIIYDDAEAEDIMQTAYINAYLNLSKFAFKSSFATWLIRILVNECLLRLKRRGRSLAMDHDHLDKSLLQQQRVGEGKTPITEVMNKELKCALHDAIRELPEIYRTVFVMREVENMNVAETTVCLGISEANVKVRLNRAKAMLKNSLTAIYNHEDILHFHLTRCDRLVTLVMDKIR